MFSNEIGVSVHGGKIIEEFMGVKRGQERFSVTQTVSFLMRITKFANIGQFAF